MIKLLDMNERAAAIICAFNEEKTIKSIIRNISVIPEINEIIVINDGSRDSTGQLIKTIKTEVALTDIHFKENKGKGFAMVKGIKMSTCEYLLFIDADLTNFTITHAHQLLAPLIEGKTDMVLGQPGKTLFGYKYNPFKKLTGQRSLRKVDILPIVDKMKDSRFGVETLINMYYKANRKKVKNICLKKLVHPTKFQKTNPVRAIIEFMAEGVQIFRTVFLNLEILVKPTNTKFLKTINNKIVIQ